MWFLAQKKFSAKSVKKWPKYGQKTISRPKRIENVVFGPENFFSQTGQKMAEKCPKYGQKMFSCLKRLKSSIGPKKEIRPNWWKNGWNMATHTHPNMQKFSFLFFPLHSALHSSAIPYLQSSATVSIYYICIMSNVHILILILWISYTGSLCLFSSMTVSQLRSSPPPP